MSTYDPSVPAVRQDDSWSCSCATTTWLLHSLGITDAYPDVERAMVHAGLVTSDLGLLDGSGGALAAWLTRTYRLDAHWQRDVSWNWLYRVAGSMPIGMGGANIYHWVAVRDSGQGVLLLSNPAPGYRGLYDTMTAAQFAAFGPWNACWIAVEARGDGEEESPEMIAELQSLLGYLQGDVADALQAGVDGARAARTQRQREDAYAAIGAAIATLRRGGPPSEDGD